MIGTAPKDAGLDGLIGRYNLTSEDGSQAGGIYLWESREKADAWYDEAWKQYMAEAWGQAPLLEYLDCPIVLDHETNNTVSLVAA